MNDIVFSPVEELRSRGQSFMRREKCNWNPMDNFFTQWFLEGAGRGGVEPGTMTEFKIYFDKFVNRKG